MDGLAEFVIDQYPKKCRLKNGIQVILRPLLKEDEKALLEYFRKLPLPDRLCLKEDVTDPQVIKNWILDMDYDQVFPLIGTINGCIVGDATLNFSPIGWTRHQAEVRFTTDLQVRGTGLATMLIQDLLGLAYHLGLELISAEVPPALNKAYNFLKKQGFSEAAILKNFVLNMEGQETDLVLMTRHLSSSNNTQTQKRLT